MIGKAYGGIALFGPAGIAMALARAPGGAGENPCLAAIEAAESGIKAPDAQKAEAETAAQDGTTEGAREGPTGPLGIAGQRLKKLLNR